MGDCHEKIKTYLIRNLEELEKGLVLFEHCSDKYGEKGIQLAPVWYPFAMSRKERDLICYNKNDNAIVIIEIKCDVAKHYTFGQILYYLHCVEHIDCANAKANEKNVKRVRGIILAEKIDESLKILINKYKNCIPEIGLITYTEDGDGNFHFDVKSPLDA